MKTLKVLPEAYDDLDQAIGWFYEHADDPELGLRLRALFMAEARRIQLDPELHSCVYKQFRHVVLRPFKYLLYYRMTDDAVVLVLLVHGARNPRYIQNQLNNRKIP